jgi:hypothetical protein
VGNEDTLICPAEAELDVFLPLRVYLELEGGEELHGQLGLEVVRLRYGPEE